MDYKIASDSVMINDVFYDTIIEQPMETDFTLPDYCPDIGRILKCLAAPRINTRSLSSNGLNIEGTTRLEVIYLDGRDKHLRCCEHDLPFSINIPLNDCPDAASAKLGTRVEYINCRAVSQRKVDIHGAFTVRVTINSRKSSEILTDAEGAGIRLRRDRLNISTCAGRTQSTFTISEALELAAGKPPIASIVRSSAFIKTAECKAISNKLIMKGEAVLKVVYVTEPDGGIESMEYSLPFNQFLDMNGADDSCMTDCSASVTSLEISLRTDPDGEYRRMGVDIRAVADAAAYTAREVSVVSDAYSVDCELKTERRYMNFERYLGEAVGRNTISAELTTEKEIARVCDIWCEFGDAAANVKENGTTVSGDMLVCAIIECADSEKEYIEKSVPFECKMSLSENIGVGHANVSVYVQSCAYNLVGASCAAVKTELVCDTSIYEDIQLSCICSIEPDESHVKNHMNEPALVVYFADAGEELWDIARAHNASVETIKAENDISEDKLEQKHMLLISVR